MDHFKVMDTQAPRVAYPSERQLDGQTERNGGPGGGMVHGD